MQLKNIGTLLDDHDYPTTSDKIASIHGEQVLHFPNGSETLGEVFGRLPTETYETPEEAHAAVYGTVSKGAIGRHQYSDRDPSPIGTPGADQVSF